MSPKPKEPVPSGFAKRIRKEMRQQDLSLRELAARAELDPATLCRILSGKQGLPNNDVMIRLAQELGMEPGELLGEAGRIPGGRADLGILMRTSSRLAQSELLQVLKLAKRLERERSPRARRKR